MTRIATQVVMTKDLISFCTQAHKNNRRTFKCRTISNRSRSEFALHWNEQGTIGRAQKLDPSCWTLARQNRQSQSNSHPQIRVIILVFCTAGYIIVVALDCRPPSWLTNEYTTMIWAETHKIGCGFIVYEIDDSLNANYLYYILLYFILLYFKYVVVIM